MKSLKIFITLFILNCSLFIGTANAQWWTQGGNLLWPYGNVTISNNLDINGNLTVKGSFTHTNDYILSGYIDLTTDGMFNETYFNYNDLNLGIDSVRIEGSNGNNFQIVYYLNNVPANYNTLKASCAVVGRYLNDVSSWRTGQFYFNLSTTNNKPALVIYGYDITYPTSRLFPPTFQNLSLKFDVHFRGTHNPASIVVDNY